MPPPQVNEVERLGAAAGSTGVEDSDGGEVEELQAGCECRTNDTSESIAISSALTAGLFAAGDVTDGPDPPAVTAEALQIPAPLDELDVHSAAAAPTPANATAGDKMDGMEVELNGAGVNKVNISAAPASTRDVSTGVDGLNALAGMAESTQIHAAGANELEKPAAAMTLAGASDAAVSETNGFEADVDGTGLNALDAPATTAMPTGVSDIMGDEMDGLESGEGSAETHRARGIPSNSLPNAHPRSRNSRGSQQHPQLRSAVAILGNGVNNSETPRRSTRGKSIARNLSTPSSEKRKAPARSLLSRNERSANTKLKPAQLPMSKTHPAARKWKGWFGKTAYSIPSVAKGFSYVCGDTRMDDDSNDEGSDWIDDNKEDNAAEMSAGTDTDDEVCVKPSFDCESCL